MTDKIGFTEAFLRAKDTGLVRARAAGLRSVLKGLLYATTMGAIAVGIGMAVRVYTQSTVGPIPPADSTRETRQRPVSTGSSPTGSSAERRQPGVNSRTTRSQTGSASGSRRSRGSTATAAGG